MRRLVIVLNLLLALVLVWQCYELGLNRMRQYPPLLVSSVKHQPAIGENVEELRIIQHSTSGVLAYSTDGGNTVVAVSAFASPGRFRRRNYSAVLLVACQSGRPDNGLHAFPQAD